MTARAHVPFTGPRLAAFATLGVATGAFNIPLQVFLPAYYTSTAGIGLQSVGLIFMVARLWAAVCDPLVGWGSDHTHTPFGRRKPWILAGGMVFLGGLIAVFHPPHGAGSIWLAVSLFLLCLGWTATSTPHVAWAGEFATDPRERARAQAYIQTGASIGIFCVLLLPSLFDATGVHDPRVRVETMGAFVALTLIIGLALIARLFRESPVSSVPGPRAGHRAGFAALLSDTLLWRIIASDFCVALGQGSRGAVFVFFVTQYMHLSFPSSLLLMQYVFGIFASPLWARISYHLGRARTLIVAELTQVAINLTLLLVTQERLWLLIALIVAQGLTQGSGNLMLRAMIYDIADRHRRLGVQRAGLFSSIFNVTTNAAMAVSVALAFVLLGRFGFHPSGANDMHALAGLAAFFALGPAAGHLASALLIYRFPIDDRPSAAGVLGHAGSL